MTEMAVVVVRLSVNVRSEIENKTHHRNITSTTSNREKEQVFFSLPFFASHRSEPLPYIEFVVRKYGYFYYDINKFVLIPTNRRVCVRGFFFVAFVFLLLCVVSGCLVLFRHFFLFSSFAGGSPRRHSHAQCEF